MHLSSQCMTGPLARWNFSVFVGSMSLNTTLITKMFNPHNNIPMKYCFIALHIAFVCLLETEKQDADMFPFKSMGVYAGYASVAVPHHRGDSVQSASKIKKCTMQRHLVFCAERRKPGCFENTRRRICCVVGGCGGQL